MQLNESWHQGCSAVTVNASHHSRKNHNQPSMPARYNNQPKKLCLQKFVELFLRKESPQYNQFPSMNNTKQPWGPSHDYNMKSAQLPAIFVNPLIMAPLQK